MRLLPHLFAAPAIGLGLAIAALALSPQSALAQQGEGTATGASAATAPELPILASTDTEALKQKDGQKVTVVGKCDRTGKSSGGTNFINFAGSEFTLVTFKSDLGPFTAGEPADIYEGKYLSVTGVVGIYKDSPQIKLTDPAQVKVSDEAFEAPDPEAKKQAEVAAAAKAEAAKKAAEAEKAKAAAAGKDGAPATGDGKPKPPVDPRKYFRKPGS